jgi:hypothetical protein
MRAEEKMENKPNSAVCHVTEDPLVPPVDRHGNQIYLRCVY